MPVPDPINPALNLTWLAVLEAFEDSAQFLRDNQRFGLEHTAESPSMPEEARTAEVDRLCEEFSASLVWPDFTDAVTAFYFFARMNFAKKLLDWLALRPEVMAINPFATMETALRTVLIDLWHELGKNSFKPQEVIDRQSSESTPTPNLGAAAL
jgi:hypothetical protein